MIRIESGDDFTVELNGDAPTLLAEVCTILLNIHLITKIEPEELMKLLTNIFVPATEEFHDLHSDI